MGHWLIIDLEATTEEGGWPLTDMEIIEIGASLATADGREVDHFQRFVRPQRRPQLTTFCRRLTRINQVDIDAAADLPQVWREFEHWLSPHAPRLAGWGSWGEYDLRQLQQEWQRHQLRSLLGAYPHLNLKQAFAQTRQLPKAVGLNGALQLAGLSFQGQQHRALADARNTARLLPLLTLQSR